MEDGLKLIQPVFLCKTAVSGHDSAEMVALIAFGFLNGRRSVSCSKYSLLSFVTFGLVQAQIAQVEEP